MTNLNTLFSELLRLCQRSIQVGGGHLWLDEIGTTVIKLENSRCIFLEDTLYVPGIGYMLVSAKKLLGLELIGQFDAYYILFSGHNNNLLLIKAKVKNSLYIVSKIAKEANNISFPMSIRQVKPIAKLDEITVFTTTLSSTTPL